MSKKSGSRWRRHKQRPALKPGLPPGTLQADPEAPRPVINVMAYSADKLVEKRLERPDQIPEFLKQWPVTWVNVEGLGDAHVIAEIGKIFGLHILALEDVVNTHQRAKVEHYGDHHYVVTHEVDLHEHLEFDQISLFFGPKFVLTFQEHSGDCLNPVRERLRQNTKIRAAGADYLMYAILDAVIDHYFPVIEAYGERLEDLEQRVINGGGRQLMADILATKRELLHLRRIVWPQRDAINLLIRDPIDCVAQETRIFLRDCHDHIIRIIDLLETYRELGSDLMELRLSSASTRMNEVMQWLTVISTIFIPLTFIVGIYGMNFDPHVSPWNMPELEAYYGYPAVMGLMLVIAIIQLMYFWRRGWLGGNTAAAPPPEPDREPPASRSAES